MTESEGEMMPRFSEYFRQSATKAIFFALAFPAVAAAATETEVCADEGFVASQVMILRQNPRSDINKMMVKFGDSPGARSMILEAFQMPQMPTKATRAQVIEEFQNRWSLKCYQDGPVFPRK